MESITSGKPVVAVKEGGFEETKVHGETELLVGANRDELVRAVKEIAWCTYKYKGTCIKVRQGARHSGISGENSQINPR